jgi:hypothetical protein
MKKHISTYSLLILAVGLLSLTSCKKESMATVTPPANNNNTSQMGTLYFHIHTNISNTEADSGVVVHDTITNRQFKLNTAQFFISNVVAHASSGTSYTISGVYLLKTIGEEHYLVGNVPAGNYSYVSFDVGVDSAANSKQPSAYTAPNPLATASMYNGGWFGGTFIFMNIEGYADTSSNQSGKFAPFSYQTGTDPAKAFTVGANQQYLIHIIADYGKLLQNVNFKTQATSNPWDNLPVIQAIAANIPNMFRYEN